MVKTKYVNRVYKEFKYIVNSLAMWDNKKFMYVSVDYVIYEMCDVPKNISREDILKEVIPKLNKKKIRLDSSVDNEIYSLSWYEMSTTKIKLKLYVWGFIHKHLAELMSLTMISSTVILCLLISLTMDFVTTTFDTKPTIAAFLLDVVLSIIYTIWLKIYNHYRYKDEYFYEDIDYEDEDTDE